MPKLTEQILTEQALIDWFKQLGYEYKFGPDISTGGLLVERDFKDVLLENRLRNALKRLNPDLPEKAIDEAVYKLKKVEHPNLEMVNREIYKMLTEGVKVEVETKERELRGRFVKVFDFENPLNNEFLVVNQFTVQGIEKVRRPDVVVFINGIPVAIFELKNPRIEEATIQVAYEQLQDYKKDIPEIFKYNQILVISDLAEARYGTISSFFEWFKVWRGIEKKEEKLEGISELEVLVKGLFQKTRLLDIIKNFIVFEADSEKEVSKFTKKICLYHQYFGVNKAIERTLKALKPKGDGRIGVLWHTQGSGKTLEMVFYVNKVKEIKELESPTFVFLTDRNDLDNQFYKTFLRTGYAFLAKQAESIKDLKKKLKTAGGELIFTTIQKFAEDFGVLSERKNIIVIADEAHRSEYAKLAANARKSLPNASFMGITATPIDTKNRSTPLVFGDYIDTYPMSQSTKDGATVPIYYEARLASLRLTNYFIDEEFNDLTQEVDFEIKESLKRKFARLEQAVSVPDRLKKIAENIVNHFNNRGLEGKAMVVTISRRVAVEMYKLISQIPNAPEVAVVISRPEEFKGEIKGETRAEEIERRFKNPEDPLRMVIVCDMWLTGFDVPCLHTMYFDKPLKNHGLMQAIARVNRIFKDKQGGLIVDYIGIADDLKKALSIYDPEIRKEAMIPLQDIVNKMLEKYDIVKSMFQRVDYSKWKYLEGEKLAQILQQAVNAIITDPKDETLDEKRKERFLKESLQLIKLHAFVMPHKDAYDIKHDVDFFKAVRAWIIKQTSVKSKAGIETGLESTIKELVSKSIAAEGIIDILSLKEKGKLEISILDEKFLDEARKIKYKNLAIEVLKKLLEDEISLRRRKNNIRYKTLAEMLQKIIEEYEDRIISASKVIERLIELAKEIRKADKAAQEMNLTEEELAFYDAIKSKRKINQDEKIKKIVKELVKMIEKDLTIDWTNNDIIKARIRDNARLLLLKNQFLPKETEEITNLIYQQAVSLYKDYVPAMIVRESTRRIN
jgi:type I restriction enzyme R subunit